MLRLLYFQKAVSHVVSGDLVHARNTEDLPNRSQDDPTPVLQSHEQYDHDAEVEEILSHRAHHASTPICFQPSGHVAGSNSVLFPDSRTNPTHDSPGSSVNADVSSSTWQASSSFSTHSRSNTHRGSSNQTSLTCITSMDMNSLEDLKHGNIHAARVNSGCSMPSPRIRYTKILGSPRSTCRMNTLSASSFSSVGSIINTGLATYRPGCYQPGAAYGRTLVKGATNSLNSLVPPPHPFPSDNDREFLTSDSDLNNDETADIQVGRRVLSHRPILASRRKVPLAEIIGRPLEAPPSTSSLQSHLDSLRESNQLNPSPSIGSIASAIVAYPTGPMEQHQLQPSKEAVDPPNSRVQNVINEESSFSLTNTSSSVNTLRSQLSNTMHLCSSPPSEPALNEMSKSLPSPRDAHHQNMIEEVDEGHDDSYEFLEREEAQGLAHETPNRKRKRLLHRSDLIHFRRPGLAAIDLSSSKLLNLTPGESQPKPKTNVMKKLGLSRGAHHKRHPTDNSQGPTTDTEDHGESPTKKIRVLQSEINRLRQELENEKTKSAQRNSMYMSLNQPERRARQASGSPHVVFSPRSSLHVSSPVSSSRVLGRRCQLISPSHSQPSSKRNSGMTDSPVVVRKPCDGASVGGSPFIVSRVYGQGPEVVGESTPAQAEKWLQKKKVASASQISGIAHDLFGAKSSKLTQSSDGNGVGHQTGVNSTGGSGWNRDRELEADLFSSPRARTLKKLNRNSKIGPVVSRSNIRTLFRNSINDFHRHVTPGSSNSTRPSAAASQAPDMATFLHELKTSGRSRLRKTPGSTKYYNMPLSIGSPKSNYGKYQDPRTRRSVDCHNASILNTVLQNYPPSSQRPPKPSNSSNSSRTSTVSGRTQGTASSTNTHESERPNTPTVFNAQPNPSHQCRSPLARKVYPSGSSTQPSGVESRDVHVVLGEAISTPRKSKQTAHLSRSLIDPHMTPRARGLTNGSQPASPIQKDFTMEELIQQVKELKDHQAIADEEAGGPPVPQADSKIRNHELVHEMGFCSSTENSLDLGSFSQSILSGGSNPSTASMSPVTNSHTIYQETTNRQRTSPLLKSLTEGRPKPKTSPTKDSSSQMKGSRNRWSSNSTIRLVSILNHSVDEGNTTGEIKGDGSLAGSLRMRPSDRRVRILEDQTNINKSRSSSDFTSGRRNSMPVQLAYKHKQLASFPEDENHQAFCAPTDNDHHSLPDESHSSAGPGWVLLKPDVDRPSKIEPNLRRWSLKTSAILTANPKLT